MFRLGVPRGNLQVVAREVAGVNASADTFELDGHGFETGDAVTVRAAEGGSLPSPLVEGTTYYAIRVNASAFKLSASDGGVPVNLTSAGSGVFVAIELPIEELITATSQWMYDCLPAHVMFADNADVPMLLRVTCAEIVGKKAMALCGRVTESADAYELAAKAKLERWATGLPNRAAAEIAAPANLAARSTLTATASDSRGWGSGSLP